MSRINASTASMSAVTAMSALQTLQAGIGKDKVQKHVFIVGQVATIVALALCHEAPKGMGNPADHAKLYATFNDAGLTNYAQHSNAVKVALKGRGRSCASWDAAYEEGMVIVLAAYAGCAPKEYTKAELKAREEKRATKKAEKAKADKAAAEAAAEAAKAARQAVYDEGRANAVITAQAVADLIRAGNFDAEGLRAIAAALKAAPVDVAAREVLAIA